jgi:serine protease Do
MRDFIHSRRFRALKLTIPLLVLSTVGLSAFSLYGQANDRPQAPANHENLRHAFALSDAFQNVAKAVAPSVVNIQSRQRMERQPTANPEQTIPPGLEEFFRRFGDPRFFEQPPDVPRTGEGSGVVVREDGYILTNNHVVANASEITIRLSDDREMPASIVGTDPESDLAVVKVDASGLTAAKFGDSDKMEVGHWVLAIGSPFGLTQTVTAGIVSAKGRQVGIIQDARGYAGFEDFIQTDAAINPGNSGGPLVNLYGEVIGVNTAINTRSGGYDGVGFAIPSNMAQKVMSSIIETGSVRRGAIGAVIGPVTQDHADYFGYQGTEGAIINQVYPGSAADKAGLKAGDIIVSIDDHRVTDTRSLVNQIASHNPGAKVELDVFRDGKTKPFTLTLGDRSQQYAGRFGDSPDTSNTASPTARTLGMTVATLTPELARELDVENLGGVVVTAVEPDGPAARKGLRSADVIARVDDKPVASVEDFDQAVSKADPGKGVSLQVFRGGAATLVILKDEPNRGNSMRR